MATCPSRFRQDEIALRDIVEDYFGSENNLLLFPEVFSGDQALGYFDYVIVRHKPMSHVVEDFVIVEFQTVDTTNTGALGKAVTEFQKGMDVTQQSYSFGLNWSNVWKRAFVQLLNKGRVLEQWGRRAYWVVQVVTYEYLVSAYGLEHVLRQDTAESIRFMVYDIEDNREQLQLRHRTSTSTSVAQLLSAFASNPGILSKDFFLRRLN